jgi:hypothetical protein
VSLRVCFYVFLFIFNADLFAGFYFNTAYKWTAEPPVGYTVNEDKYPQIISFTDQSGIINIKIYTVSSFAADTLLYTNIISGLEVKGLLDFYSYGSYTYQYGKLHQTLKEGRGVGYVLRFKNINNMDIIILAVVPMQYALKEENEIL